MTLNEFKLLNKQVGSHWFDDATIAFFSSRISNWNESNGLFITSEAGPNGIRAYSVRKANFETGEVKTIGEFQCHKTLGAAKRSLRCVAKYI